MGGFTKLFSSLVTSSIWQEDNATRLVWITMLATADARGIVEASVIGLAHIARVDVDECERALRKLENPDPYSRTKEFEGRRIEPYGGGWRILNFPKYREKGRSLSRQEYFREYQKRRRSGKAKPPVEATLFDRFWSAYPRKVGKDLARKAFDKRKPDAAFLSVVLDAIDAQKRTQQWMEHGGKFIPHPATWLNQGRWQDEVVEDPNALQFDGVDPVAAVEMYFESGQIDAVERDRQLAELRQQG